MCHGIFDRDCIKTAVPVFLPNQQPVRRKTVIFVYPERIGSILRTGIYKTEAAMDSLWMDETKIQSFPELTRDITADVAVVGGGMTGILTAYFLKEQGLQAIVLEADRVGGGQTGRTTAKITSQHGVIYQKIISLHGKEAAEKYSQENQKAIDRYEKIVQDRQIDCGFVRCPAYLYTLESPELLKEEAQCAAGLGIDAVFTRDTELPFEVAGAVRFDDQARFHPLLFLESVIQGLTVYEHSRVLQAEGDRLVTEKGSVRAKKIVFACHYPFLNVPGYYFMRMHQERSYVLGLENALKPEGMYLGIDSNNAWSFRSAGEYLLFGGGGHRTGENRAGGKYDLLKRKAEEFFPGSRVRYHWSAQDCMPVDQIPYIGRFSADTPDWYAATGYGKWGMSSSMAAAGMITESILGNEEGNVFGIFSPQRFTPKASAENFCKDGIHAVKDLSRRIFTQGRSDLDELPPGHGGIVDYDGEKVGAYRDEEGEIYLVSAKCPHLGCQLEWNPDEKCFECPCHGSRFDYMGNCVDSPAQSGISLESKENS